MISEMRRRDVWLLRLKKSVSSVIRSCRRCRRFIAAFAAEITAPLPDCRMNFTRAFDTTGMDLGGPLLLKDGLKVWFVVFTCMSVRAVHLELASSMSSESLMCAFQRFVSRRGMPRRCISDHGTNFVALSRYMKDRRLEVSYEFIVERGPRCGGVWERMVQTVKGLLKRTISHLGTAGNGARRSRESNKQTTHLISVERWTCWQCSTTDISRTVSDKS